MSKFICKCGKVYREEEEPEGASGLLKSLKAQVDLEDYQAQEIAKYIELNDSEKQKWISDHFGSEYPKDVTTKELIEDFLYKSHRQNGCTATFSCPSCGRVAFLYDVNEQWKFYAPED